MDNIKFHLAIPSKDIKESMEFYANLGFKIGRFSEKFCIIDLFGAQLVCHLSQEIEKGDGIYPRHFGIIVGKTELNYLKEWVSKLDLKFHLEPFSRHIGTPFEHESFFLKDPSNNKIEFKSYVNQGAI